MARSRYMDRIVGKVSRKGLGVNATQHAKTGNGGVHTRSTAANEPRTETRQGVAAGERPAEELHAERAGQEEHRASRAELQREPIGKVVVPRGRVRKERPRKQSVPQRVVTLTPPVRPRRRARPGMAALREIRRMQRSTERIIPRLPFSRLVHCFRMLLVRTLSPLAEPKAVPVK